MGINSQRNAHIRMSHQILQSLNIHTGVCHVDAEGVPEHMGRDSGQGDDVQTESKEISAVRKMQPLLSLRLPELVFFFDICSSFPAEKGPDMTH